MTPAGPGRAGPAPAGGRQALSAEAGPALHMRLPVGPGLEPSSIQIMLIAGLPGRASEAAGRATSSRLSARRRPMT
jgi:hypothetical protein